MSGPAGEKPLFADGHDGTLRYGRGGELRIGRAPLSEGSNNVQLKSSPKVSRCACRVAWDEALARFCLTDLSSGGVVVDGRKAAARTPLTAGSSIAFYGNPQWPVGHQPGGAVPANVFIFELRSVAPPSDARWELPSPLVSREHGALEYDAQACCWTAMDTGSTYGTAVDGASLPAHGPPMHLRLGSELIFGASLAGADARVLGFVLEEEC